MSRPGTVTPIRRDLRFALPQGRIRDWHGGGRHVTHFYNALSLLFPAGERFFIHSVRHYKGSIRSRELRRAASAFIGQEAIHGREHNAYNRLLDRGGLPARRLETEIERLLAIAQRLLPPSWQLTATIALEHFTAILADQLLRDPRQLGGSEPAFRNLWRWHALEETEHKAVAFDIWNEIASPGLRGYLQRILGMTVMSVLFAGAVAVLTAALTESDPKARRQTGGYIKLARYLLGQPGLVRRGFGDWLRYFERAFHPWQHDNRFLLRRAADIAAEARDGALRATA